MAKSIFTLKDIFLNNSKGALARYVFLNNPHTINIQKTKIYKLLLSNKPNFFSGLLGYFFIFLDFIILKKITILSFDDKNYNELKTITLVRRRILLVANRWMSAPPYHAGGLILNLFGLQVIRTLRFNLKFFLRKFHYNLKNDTNYNHASNNLSKYGYLIIERPFSQEDFVKIKKFILEDKSYSYQKRINHSSGWKKWTLSDPEGNILNVDLKKPIQKLFNSTGLLKIIESATNKKLIRLPEIAIFEWIPSSETIGKPNQFDYEDLFHADVSYPSYKAFIYLNDVSADNGAFTFCPSSHRLTLRRLLFEYLLSIAFFASKLINAYKPQPHKFTEFWLKLFNIEKLSLEGAGNTLILANVMRFHKRHNFNIKKTRQLLFLNFRYIEDRI